MPSRFDTTGEYSGLSEEAVFALSRLSARALEGRALAGVDELALDDCADPLEALAWPASDSMERLQLWLGADHAVAVRKARRLRSVLEACATVVICADPAQTRPMLGALQRFAYYLATAVEGRPRTAPAVVRDASSDVLASLQRRILALSNGQSMGLALVHCGAVDQADAMRGLHAGDAVVRTILGTLRQQVLRPSDTVEPISRDEFACLLHPMPSEGVAILAAQKVLRVLDTPMEVDDFAVAPEPHIGLALWPEHGKDAGQLLQHAKAALRIARSGHERIALYHADAPGTEFDESRYAARLRHAIQNNGLALFFQPQADFRSGEIVGAEALLRWNDEQLGPVAPNVAVAVAESAGMMNDLTMWVISSAIQQCALFRKLRADFTMSVNISPSNLHEADLPAYVERALRTWDVSARGIIFEVTAAKPFDRRANGWRASFLMRPGF